MAITSHSCNESHTRASIRIPRLRFKRSLGQNFIVNDYYLRKIAETLPAGANVIEIGAGFGALTKLLAERGNRVHAFEIDKGIFDIISAESWAKAVTLINDDCRNFDKYINKDSKYSVVSALPYSLYKAILLRLWGDLRAFADFYLILQHDVFKRLSVQKGRAVNAFSTITRYLFDVKPFFKIPASAFYPKPHVDSFYFRLTPRPQRRLQDVGRLYQGIQALFSDRRKTADRTGRRIEELGPDEIVRLVNGTFEGKCSIKWELVS